MGLETLSDPTTIYKTVHGPANTRCRFPGESPQLPIANAVFVTPHGGVESCRTTWLQEMVNSLGGSNQSASASTDATHLLAKLLNFHGSQRKVALQSIKLERT